MKNVNPIQAAPIVVLFMLVTAACLAAQPAAPGMSPAAAEAKAREIEAKMTDDERFGLIKNLMVVNFRTTARRPSACWHSSTGRLDPRRAKTRHSRSGDDGCKPRYHQSWERTPQL